MSRFQAGELFILSAALSAVLANGRRFQERMSNDRNDRHVPVLVFTTLSPAVTPRSDSVQGSHNETIHLYCAHCYRRAVVSRQRKLDYFRQFAGDNHQRNGQVSQPPFGAVFPAAGRKKTDGTEAIGLTEKRLGLFSRSEVFRRHGMAEAEGIITDVRHCHLDQNNRRQEYKLPH